MRRTGPGGWLAAVLISILVLASGCAGGVAPELGVGAEAGQPATLNVFAAASLTDAFGAIGERFAAEHAGVDVVFNFAGSNQLATQIGEGAPADVFAPANAAQMEAAVASGRIASTAPQTFAHNRLVIVTPGDNPAGLATLQDLAVPGVKIVLATEAVPAGQYALDFLDKAAAAANLGAGYRDAVLGNVVSYEASVRGVLTKVTLGEADAGIVYRSDAASTAGEVQEIAIPAALNSVAAYPIAVLDDSPQAALAQAFVDAVRSAEGQQVLEQYGFVAADEE